jgi:predicted nucleic acid-binding Zn ribbon protein
VGEILREALRGLGVEERVESAKLGSCWAEIVGETVASKSRPLDLRDGTLFVEAENNVWMQEISFHRERIIARIRKRFPGLMVTGIRLMMERERSEG